ncbi:SPFH domain-containing protein [Streptomyces sp. NPDC053431]|uniref:SPFH domain-containing protein n=1 Tax=Streptomyces sp. NPDC053431 TaxID=3365703 RepID=UPI0037D7615E
MGGVDAPGASSAPAAGSDAASQNSGASGAARTGTAPGGSAAHPDGSGAAPYQGRSGPGPERAGSAAGGHATAQSGAPEAADDAAPHDTRAAAAGSGGGASAGGSGAASPQARPGLRPASPGLARGAGAKGEPGPRTTSAAPVAGSDAVPQHVRPLPVSPGLATAQGATHDARRTAPADAVADAASPAPARTGGPADAAVSTAPAPVPAAAGDDHAPPPGAGSGDAPGARTAAPAGARAESTGPAGPSPTARAPRVATTKAADDAADPGWIAGVRVRSVAVPVAATVEVVPRGSGGNGNGSAGTNGNGTAGNNGNSGGQRRRNVIGSETTGSIPVHLLFREESDGAGDGGPATVPVPKVSAADKASATSKAGARKGKGKAPVPGAARHRHAAGPARPAPTADPKLVERPGPVLPGWIGAVGGALALLGCALLVWWTGAVPAEVTRMLRVPARPYHGIHLWQWALLALGVLLTLFFLGGLGRGRVGYALVLTLFGDYRGTVRRTGLLWVSPLLLRRRVDVRLRHWRSEPLPAVDAKGTALDVVVLVVWRIRDTVRAALGVDRHEEYLREQVEAAMARVLSQLPADAFHEDAPTLRDAEAVGEALTRVLSAECAPVGIDVFSAQPTRIEYAPEVAAAMRRRRIAAIDAKHRDSVLTSVVDAVDDVVHRLTSRGLVELDDYDRKALVKDLTVAFYTGRTAPGEGA